MFFIQVFHNALSAVDTCDVALKLGENKVS